MEQVIRLAEKYRKNLGTVRTLAGWKASSGAGLIWLRGPLDTGKLPVALAALPADANFLLDEHNRLFPLGKHTPVGVLPELKWLELADFLPLQLPVSALPGVPDTHVTLRLSRSGIVKEPAALLVSLADWQAYALTAPSIRLAALRFAVNEEGEVLVMGNPLPPVPGRGFGLRERLLLPAGLDFEPPVLGALVLQQLLPSPVDWLLFDAKGAYSRIPAAALVAAERSVIRAL